jgi:hypothetical protein
MPTHHTLTEKIAHKGYLSVGGAIHHGWAIFKENWWQNIALLLIPTVISVGLVAIQLSLRISGIGGILFSVFRVVFNLGISVGVLKIWLKMTREEHWEWSELWSHFPLLPNYFLGCILYLLIILGGLLLLVIPGIIWSYKYQFIPFLIVDKGLGPLEAMRMSARMTQGVKWDLLAFYSAVTTIVYLGLIALLVGLLVSIPVAVVAYLAMYQLLLDRDKELHGAKR